MDRSAFNIFTTDNAIMNDATNYDLTINDERVLVGASISGDDGGDDQQMVTVATKETNKIMHSEYVYIHLLP